MATTDRRVLLLKLDYYSWIDHYWDSFLEDLNEKCTLLRVNTVSEAFQHLHPTLESRVSAVLVWSPDLINCMGNERTCNKSNFTKAGRDELYGLATAIMQFTVRGGTTILGGPLTYCVDEIALKAFFREIWAVSWECDGTREIEGLLNWRGKAIDLCEASINLDDNSSRPLFDMYSAKALCLKRVLNEDLVYIDSDRLSSRPQISDSMIDSGSVVFTQYVHGKLGYDGDVQNEVGTQEVVFTMLGV